MGIIPSLVLIFFENLPSFRIGAYRLVLIKDTGCTIFPFIDHRIAGGKGGGLTAGAGRSNFF